MRMRDGKKQFFCIPMGQCMVASSFHWGSAPHLSRTSFISYYIETNPLHSEPFAKNNHEDQCGFGKESIA